MSGFLVLTVGKKIRNASTPDLGGHLPLVQEGHLICLYTNAVPISGHKTFGRRPSATISFGSTSPGDTSSLGSISPGGTPSLGSTSPSGTPNLGSTSPGGTQRLGSPACFVDALSFDGTVPPGIIEWIYGCDLLFVRGTPQLCLAVICDF